MQSGESVDPAEASTTDSVADGSSLQGDASVAAEMAANQPGAIRIIRRNGKVTLFSKDKITVAVTKAFLDNTAVRVSVMN